MLKVAVRAKRVCVGESFCVSFQRTQAVTTRLHTSLPPPSWGILPVHPVSDYPARFPQLEGRANAFLIPVGEEESVWLGFGQSAWPPRAVKVGVDGRNAVSGTVWSADLSPRPQDYLVSPPQQSLEGVRAQDGSVRQIIRRTESDISDWEVNLIKLLVYESKSGLFSASPAPRLPDPVDVLHGPHDEFQPDAGAQTLGGRIEKEIRPDPYGPETWDAVSRVSFCVYMVGHEEYKEVTGLEPPPRRDPADVYRGYRLP
jgi:hypothetical protein